jgi:phosphorylcholine metabolism protein LicD
VEEFTAEHGELAYVVLSMKDYENLAINVADLRRYIEQQTEIIVYYENAVQPLDTDTTTK